MRQLEPLTWKIAPNGGRQLHTWVYWVGGLFFVSAMARAVMDFPPFLISQTGFGVWMPIFTLMSVCIGIWSAVVFAIETKPLKYITETTWKWYYPFRIVILASPLFWGFTMALGFSSLVTFYGPRMGNHALGEPARLEVAVRKIERRSRCNSYRCLPKLLGLPKHVYQVELQGYRAAQTRGLRYYKYPAAYVGVLPIDQSVNPPVLSEFSGTQSWFGMHVKQMRPLDPGTISANDW